MTVWSFRPAVVDMATWSTELQEVGFSTGNEAAGGSPAAQPRGHRREWNVFAEGDETSLVMRLKRKGPVAFSPQEEGGVEFPVRRLARVESAEIEHREHGDRSAGYGS